MNNDNNNHPRVNREDTAAVVSGSDIFDSSDDEEESEFESESERNIHNKRNDKENSNSDNPKINKYGISTIDELYNPNGDDEDEAYVYRHLRGGIEENVNVAFPSKLQSNDNEINFANSRSNTDTDKDKAGSTTKTQQQEQQSQQMNQHNQNYNIMEQAKILKPRNSDGILSCPCCFQIVCMDCQKHETYSNQFRAMFVMNIGVDWDVTVSTTTGTNHNHRSRSQHQHQQQQQGNPSNGNNDNISGTNNTSLNNKPIIPTDEECKKADDDIYYSVYCNNCRTQVAALDMRDEVYHFFGCIVSG